MADGVLFDVWTTSGAILDQDAAPAREGLQLAARNGRLTFPLRSSQVPLPAEITARSVAGKAAGRATLELTDVRAFFSAVEVHLRSTGHLADSG